MTGFECSAQIERVSLWHGLLSLRLPQTLVLCKYVNIFKAYWIHPVQVFVWVDIANDFLNSRLPGNLVTCFTDWFSFNYGVSPFKTSLPFEHQEVLETRAEMRQRCHFTSHASEPQFFFKMKIADTLFVNFVSHKSCDSKRGHQRNHWQRRPIRKDLEKAPFFHHWHQKVFLLLLWVCTFFWLPTNLMCA